MILIFFNCIKVKMNAVLSIFTLCHIDCGISTFTEVKGLITTSGRSTLSQSLSALHSRELIGILLFFVDIMGLS